MKKQKQIDSLEQRVSNLEFEFAIFQEETEKSEEKIDIILKNLLQQMMLLNVNLQTFNQRIQDNSIVADEPMNQTLDNEDTKGVSTKQLIDEWVNGEEATHE